MGVSRHERQCRLRELEEHAGQHRPVLILGRGEDHLSNHPRQLLPGQGEGAEAAHFSLGRELGGVQRRHLIPAPPTGHRRLRRAVSSRDGNLVVRKRAYNLREQLCRQRDGPYLADLGRHSPLDPQFQVRSRKTQGVAAGLEQDVCHNWQG